MPRRIEVPDDQIRRARDAPVAYVRSEATNAFALAGTLRQFTDLWQLDRQGEGPWHRSGLRAASFWASRAAIYVTPRRHVGS
jgi:hypothetical protein